MLGMRVGAGVLDSDKRSAQVEASPRDMRRVMMRGRKVAAWKRLSLSERDVLTVLSAICKARRMPGPPLVSSAAFYS